MLWLQDTWAHSAAALGPAVSHFSNAAGSLMMVLVLCLSSYKNTLFTGSDRWVNPEAEPLAVIHGNRVQWQVFWYLFKKKERKKKRLYYKTWLFFCLELLNHFWWLRTQSFNTFVWPLLSSSRESSALMALVWMKVQCYFMAVCKYHFSSPVPVSHTICFSSVRGGREHVASDFTEHTACSLALPTPTLCTQNHNSLLRKFLFTNLQHTGANRLQLRGQETIWRDEESLTTVSCSCLCKSWQASQSQHGNYHFLLRSSDSSFLM